MPGANDHEPIPRRRVRSRATSAYEPAAVDTRDTFSSRSSTTPEPPDRRQRNQGPPATSSGQEMDRQDTSIVSVTRSRYLTENQNKRSRECWHERAEEILEARHYYDRLIRYAAGCIRGCQLKEVDLGVEPEDLVHHAFVMMLEGRLNWHEDVDGTVNSLITTIGNEFKNLLRKATRRADPVWQARMNGRCEPGAAEDAQVIRIDVRESVARLPPKLREAVVACVFEDQHPTQYAATVMRSATTVRNSIGAAKAALRRNLSAYRAQSADDRLSRSRQFSYAPRDRASSGVRDQIR